MPGMDLLTKVLISKRFKNCEWNIFEEDTYFCCLTLQVKKVHLGSSNTDPILSSMALWGILHQNPLNVRYESNS